MFSVYMNVQHLKYFSINHNSIFLQVMMLYHSSQKHHTNIFKNVQKLLNRIVKSHLNIKMNSLMKHEIKTDLKSIVCYTENKVFYINLTANLFAVFRCKMHDVVMGSHGGGSGGSGSRHVCIIAIFLLVRLLYLLIHSLNYLFKSIQTLTMLTDFIDLVAVSSLITYYLLNLFLKLIFSH